MTLSTPSQGLNSLSHLSHAQYGKTNIRVFRVVRDAKWHRIVEYNVTLLVEGDIQKSYTEADNSVVVATDSMKNITYYLAKVSPHVLNAEKFAIHLGTHILSKYAHLRKAFVTIEQLRWTRVPVEGSQGVVEHPHAFYRDGEDKRVVKVEIDATNGKDRMTAQVSAGITDLLGMAKCFYCAPIFFLSTKTHLSLALTLASPTHTPGKSVLKSTGSGFTGFVRDEYTTLVEVDDRIFSTSVDLEYTFAPVAVPLPKDEKKLEFLVPDVFEQGTVWDEKVAERARKATLEVFAKDESASVQATLYKMGQRVVAENAGIARVAYTLPNKHYVPVDMRYIGVDNQTPSKAEVFTPIAHPSGQICATVTRGAEA